MISTFLYIFWFERYNIRITETEILIGIRFLFLQVLKNIVVFAIYIERESFLETIDFNYF